MACAQRTAPSVSAHVPELEAWRHAAGLRSILSDQSEQSTDAWRKSPAALKGFNTAIPNLLDPDTIERRIATCRAQWESGTRTGIEDPKAFKATVRTF